jgi:hypothetical protein
MSAALPIEADESRSLTIDVTDRNVKRNAETAGIIA